MATILFIIFILFTLIYGLFSAVIIYHLKQYAMPGNYESRIAIASYLFLSVLFWFFAAYFLIEIRFF